MKTETEETSRACFDRGLQAAASMTYGHNLESAEFIGGFATGVAAILAELLGDDAMRQTMADAAEAAIELRAHAKRKAN